MGAEGGLFLIKKENEKMQMTDANPIVQAGDMTDFSLFVGECLSSVLSSRRAMRTPPIPSSFDSESSSPAFSLSASSRRSCKSFSSFSLMERIPRISRRVFIVVFQLVRVFGKLPSSPVKHDFGSGFPFSYNLGYFLNGKVFRIMKPQNGIGVGRQTFLGQLPERTEGSRFVVRGFFGRMTWEGNFLLAAFASDFIESEASRNGEEPGEERSVAIILLDLPVRPQKSLLSNVLSRSVRKVAEQEPADSRPMPADQLVKGFDVA